jgi:D-tyrosyl-tRNA(Tyr) deacylase
MRALIQRVSSASVIINDLEHSQIECGLLVLLGIEESDCREDVDWLAGKIARMRIFDDDDGQMNLSLADIGGDTMVISQFTLHASTRKGNRPSFTRAARPEQALPLYEMFIGQVQDMAGKPVASGQFGASMQVSLVNDGPVTIWIDSRDRR